MKHLKLFESFVSNDVLEKIQKECNTAYDELSQIEDLTIYSSAYASEYIEKMMEIFKKYIPEYDWSKAEEHLVGIVVDEPDQIEYSVGIFLDFMYENPVYFSKKLTDFNKKTGVFESTVTKDDEDRGWLKGIEEEIIKNDIDDKFVEKVVEYFEKHNFEIKFLGKMQDKNRSKYYLKFEIGGVSMIIENRDHMRPWLNNAEVTEIFKNSFFYYDMIDFINFYNENDIQLLVNKKMRPVSKLGVFDQEK